MNFAQVAACGAVLMALSAQCAQAAPALATKNVNLRQGPGTSYPVISTIPGGSTVEIGGCQGRWCTVAWQGQNGYAIATSFDQGGGGAPPGAGGPPPGTTAGGPPGAPPPGYPQGYPPPPGYAPPPGYYPPGYYPPGYYDPYGPYYGYGPYWRRRWW